MVDRKTVLITGCSDGGLGAALAVAFYENGHRVFATARNLSRMSSLKAQEIETLQLDVLSESSLSACAAEIGRLTGGSLDILINNAGGGYNMPLMDVSIDEAKKVFDLNVWSILTSSQQFLPLLLRSQSGGMIVNNTSVAAAIPMPLQGIYNASKAAAWSLTETMRIELQPFGVRVIDLRTGGVDSKFYNNLRETGRSERLPPSSLYQINKDDIEEFLRSGPPHPAIEPETWAQQVVRDLSKRTPAAQIWRGASTWLIWLGTFLPHGYLDAALMKRSGMDVLKEKVQKQGKEFFTSI